MAQTTGLGLSSSSESKVPKPTSSDFLPDVNLPNSLMSAPPQKIFPLPFKTMPLIASSARSVLRAAMRPSSTPGLSALTGGLLIVATPILPSRVTVTSSLIGEASRQILPPNGDVMAERLRSLAVPAARNVIWKTVIPARSSATARPLRLSRSADRSVDFSVCLQPVQFASLRTFPHFAKELDRFSLVAWLTRIVGRNHHFHFNGDNVFVRLDQPSPLESFTGDLHGYSLSKK